MPKGKRTNQLVLKTDNDEIELKKFKSIYYLFNAKPDTRVKILEENRKVSKTDILELNQQIIEKLKIYKVVTAMATIKLSLSDKMTLDFSNWTEFTNENFNYSSFVDLIDIDWDFYLKLPGYKNPQRHTLRLRFGSQVKPSDFLQAMLTTDSDIEISELSARVVCKVDFVNAIISTELINLVENWYKGLELTNPKNRIEKFIIKNDDEVAGFASLLFNLLGIMVGICFVNLFNNNLIGGNIIISFIKEIGIVWAFVYIFGYIGEILQKRINKHIRKFKGQIMFNITKGDKNKHKSISKENNLSLIKIIIEFSISIISNIIMMIVNFFILHK